MHGYTLSAFESSNYLRGREIIARPHSLILYRPPNPYWMEITCPNVPNNALGGSNVRASTMYIAQCVSSSDFIIGVGPKKSIVFVINCTMCLLVQHKVEPTLKKITHLRQDLQFLSLSLHRSLHHRRQIP
jgi:hypothetical protein